jgi:hypothetical protein
MRALGSGFFVEHYALSAPVSEMEARCFFVAAMTVEILAQINGIHAHGKPFSVGVVLWDDIVIEAAPLVGYMKQQRWNRDRARAHCAERAGKSRSSGKRSAAMYLQQHLDPESEGAQCSSRS